MIFLIFKGERTSSYVVNFKKARYNVLYLRKYTQESKVKITFHSAILSLICGNLVIEGLSYQKVNF